MFCIFVTSVPARMSVCQWVALDVASSALSLILRYRKTPRLKRRRNGETLRFTQRTQTTEPGSG